MAAKEIKGVYSYDEWLHIYKVNERRGREKRAAKVKQKLVGFSLIVITALAIVLLDDASVCVFTGPVGAYFLLKKENIIS